MEASSMPNDYETDIFSRETLFPKKDRLFQGKDLSSLSSSVFRFQFSLIDWSVYRTVSQFIWIEQSCHGRFPIHSNADQIVPYAKKEANHVVRTNVKKKRKKKKKREKRKRRKTIEGKNASTCVCTLYTMASHEYNAFIIRRCNALCLSVGFWSSSIAFADLRSMIQPERAPPRQIAHRHRFAIFYAAF